MLTQIKFAGVIAAALFATQAAAVNVKILQSSALGSDPVPTRAVDPNEFLVFDANPPNGIGVEFNVTGSVENDRRDLYEDEIGSGLQGTEQYTAVRIFSAARWDRAGESVRFIWGSPDSFNTVSFLAADLSVIDKITGDTLAAQAGVTEAQGWVFAEFTPSSAFSFIQFNNSTPDAFEIGVAAIPVPAAGVMLLSALGGLAMLRRRRQTA